MLLILLGFALFEAAILSNIFFLPAIPDFLLICVMFFSFNGGKIAGECAGFLSGLFLDCLSGCPFGLNSLYRLVIGYFAGYFQKTFTLDAIILPAIICFLATLLKFFLTSVISLFYPNVVNTYRLFSLEFGFELAMNVILAPPVFKLLHCFFTKDSGRENIR